MVGDLLLGLGVSNSLLVVFQVRTSSLNALTNHMAGQEIVTLACPWPVTDMALLTKKNILSPLTTLDPQLAP